MPAPRPVSELPACPSCGSAYIYPDGSLLVCPECVWESSPADAETAATPDAEPEAPAVTDAHGTPLARACPGLRSGGDSVKNLKVKGSSSVVEVGTRVENIRLADGDHDIDCRIPGIGAMDLTSEAVRKA